MTMQFIRGWARIGEIFGVSGKVVMQWEQEGAPILVFENKPLTRLDDLWYWLLDSRKRPCGVKSNKSK